MLQQRIAGLEKANGGAAKELMDQVEAARVKVEGTEKELAGAKSKLAEMELAAKAAAGVEAKAAATKKQLMTAQGKVAELQKQMALQGKQLQELEGQVKAAAGLAKTNKELGAELDLVKSQLLVQAARSETGTVAASGEMGSRPARWAIKTGYEKATQLMALHNER